MEADSSSPTPSSTSSSPTISTVAEESNSRSELISVDESDSARFGGIDAVDATFEATFEAAADDVVDDEERVEAERRRRCGDKMCPRCRLGEDDEAAAIMAAAAAAAVPAKGGCATAAGVFTAAPDTTSAE